MVHKHTDSNLQLMVSIDSYGSILKVGETLSQFCLYSVVMPPAGVPREFPGNIFDLHSRESFTSPARILKHKLSKGKYH